MSRTETTGILLRKSCHDLPASNEIHTPFSVPAYKMFGSWMSCRIERTYWSAGRLLVIDVQVLPKFCDANTYGLKSPDLCRSMFTKTVPSCKVDGATVS